MERNDPYIAPCSHMLQALMITDTLVFSVLWTEDTMKELEKSIKDITRLPQTHSRIYLLKLDCTRQIIKQLNWYLADTKYNVSIPEFAYKLYDYIATYGHMLPTISSRLLIEKCESFDRDYLLAMLERIQNGRMSLE